MPKDYVTCFGLYFHKLAGTKGLANPLSGLSLICNTVIEARFLYELLSLSGKGRCKGSSVGWFYKSYAELSKNTLCCEYSLRSAKTWMESEGFLETKVKCIGKTRTIHWRIDFKKLRAYGQEVLTPIKQPKRNLLKGSQNMKILGNKL